MGVGAAFLKLLVTNTILAKGYAGSILGAREPLDRNAHSGIDTPPTAEKP